MTASDIALLVVALFLFGVVGYLALAETALTQMSRVKALALREKGRHGAGRLLRLVERREVWLTPLLFVMLLLNFVGATIVGIVVHRYLGALGVAVVTVAEVIVVFVLAEASPKTWAVQHDERAALVVAPVVSAVVERGPVRLLARTLIGISNFVLPGPGLKEGPFVSREELLAMADVAGAEAVIEDEERTLIHSVMELGETIVRDVRVPRTDVVTVGREDSASDVLDLTVTTGYSRFPVCGEGGLDDVIGVIHLKDLVRAVLHGQGEEPARALVRSVRFVPETKRVGELFREMQHAKSQIAIVVDEYGGTSGLVTLEDIIEEAVGELVDEFDIETPGLEWLTDTEARVNARMPVDELGDELHADLPEGEWETVGGLMLKMLGHIPVEGEVFPCAGYRFAVERIEGNRIEVVRMTRLEVDDDDTGATPEA